MSARSSPRNPLLSPRAPPSQQREQQLLAARSRTQDEREHDLDVREDDLTFREAHLQVLEARLNARSDRLETRATALRERERLLEQREDVMRNRDAEIEAQNDDIFSRFSNLSVSDAGTMAPSTASAPSSASSESSFTDNGDGSRPVTPVVLPNSQDNRRYVVRSPTTTGVVHTWAAAGHIVLPQPGAVAVRTTPLPRRSNTSKFFVVTRGARVGIFETPWPNVEPLVSKVSGAIYKGYSSREAAVLEFYVACDLGIITVLPSPNNTPLPDLPHSIIPTNPSRADINRAIASTPIPPDAPWYAVFKGIRTGVFPFWSIVSCLTQGLPISTHQRFTCRDAALNAYRAAQQGNQVHELEHGQAYYYRA